NVAKIWKNGVPIILENSSNQGSSVGSIKIVGSDVYAAGTVSDEKSGIWVAKYWKNGVGVSLSDGTKSTTAASVDVSGNDIYVTGSELNPATGVFDAKYWKNGTEKNLTNGANGVSTIAGVIFVFENDVYVLGSFGTPVYWKNSNLMYLSTNTRETENSLFVQKR
ncbi:MAG TPA: hypothetical protein VGG71_10920, partial [Chitinophagaceae bacterium]